MTIRLLAIDMDGTCLNSHNTIDEDTMQALYSAKRAGIEVVPTTGRALSCIPHQLKVKDLYRYVISSNGAVITDITTGKDIHTELMDIHTSADILDKSECMGLGAAAHIHHEYYLQGYHLRVMGAIAYGKDARYSHTVKDMRELILSQTDGIEELQFFFLTEESRTKTMKALLSHPYVCAPPDKKYVEIFASGAGKGNGITHLCEYLNIPKEQTACIGDGKNDLYMFEHTGLKFAMGNGDETLKKHADYTVASNDEGGVKEAVEIILGINDSSML